MLDKNRVKGEKSDKLGVESSLETFTMPHLTGFCSTSLPQEIPEKSMAIYVQKSLFSSGYF